MLVELWIGILLIFNSGTGEMAKYMTVPTASEQDCYAALSNRIAYEQGDSTMKIYATCQHAQFDIEHFTIENSI
jgi:hypothetical protein